MGEIVVHAKDSGLCVIKLKDRVWFHDPNGWTNVNTELIGGLKAMKFALFAPNAFLVIIFWWTFIYWLSAIQIYLFSPSMYWFIRQAIPIDNSARGKFGLFAVFVSYCNKDILFIAGVCFLFTSLMSHFPLESFRHELIIPVFHVLIINDMHQWIIAWYNQIFQN
jgi:hypothetical protein